MAELSEIEKAAFERNAQNRSVTQSGDTPIATIPGGLQIDATRYVDRRYSFKETKWWLHSPELMIKDPQPGCRYAWPILDDMGTAAKVAMGGYKYVTADRIDRTKGAELVITHVTPAKGDTHDPGDRVCWYRHVLVEVQPRMVDELYIQPSDYSIGMQAGMRGSFEQSIAAETGNKAAGTFAIKKQGDLEG